MTNIIVKLRDAIEDNYKYTTDSFEYITSKVFTLTEANIDSTTLVCYKNGVVFAASNYTYASTTGKVTVTGTLVAGDVLEFVYNAYAKYSDTELMGYIRAALGYLAIEKYKTFVSRSDNTIYPTPTENEEYLISFISSVLIKGAISSYKTPEITINFNDKISKEDKIRQAIRQFSKTYGILDYIELDEESLVEEDEDEDC
jgi:hypothetical protein